MEHLIEAVRAHAALWDNRMPEYRDATVKERAWDEISAALGKDKKQVKGEWRKLKDNHRQAINRRKTKSGQAATNRKEWKYMKQMEFLLTTMTHGETYTNIPSPSEEGTEAQLEEVDTEDFEEMPANIEADVEQTEHRERRYREPRGNDKVIHFLAEKEKRKSQQKTADELDLFFASITQTVRSLPRHLQLRLKREILNCVSLAEEQHQWATNNAMTGNFQNNYQHSPAGTSSSPSPSNSSSCDQRPTQPIQTPIHPPPIHHPPNTNLEQRPTQQIQSPIHPPPIHRPPNTNQYDFNQFNMM